MKLKEPYTDINRVLECIIYQVNDSINYCIENLPSFSTPEQMFNILKMNVTYHLDPNGTELIQSVPTLFNNNYWGVSGSGDCDCFTVLTLACCYANGWNDNEIILKGKSSKAPSHIYSAVNTNGKKYTLDLTNRYINEERYYPLTQTIKLKTK